MDARILAGKIDHTLLKPEATVNQIKAVCDEAMRFEVASVCVSSSRVGIAVAALAGSPVPVCTVIGFPTGAVNTDGKCSEAKAAQGFGAREFDMVINIGALKDSDTAEVSRDIVAVRRSLSSEHILKVIIEAAALTDAEIVLACQIAVDAGADYVKTSSGFHPSGGASTKAVRLMRETVGQSVGVKAAGGIRTLEAAQAMLDAGASRLGLSSTETILREAGYENP